MRFTVVSIILTSLIYLIYTDDFNVTVPDSWPLIAHCRRILSGDISKIWGTLLERRPFLILYYALNSLWISLFGLQGVYVGWVLVLVNRREVHEVRPATTEQNGACDERCEN